MAVILFSAVGVSSFISIRRQSADAEWVEHSHEVLEQLETTLRFATDARRSAIGYLVTGDLRRLQNAFDAQRQTVAALSQAATLTRDNPRQQERVAAMRSLMTEEQAGFNAVIISRRRDLNSAIAILQAPAWTDRFARMRSVIDAMKTEEQSLLILRHAKEEQSGSLALAIVAGGDFIAFVLMVAAFAVSGRESRQRHSAERQLSETNRELTDRIGDLQQRSSELNLLARFAQLLQSCDTLEEAGAVIGSLFPKLLPGTRGVMYTIAASRNLVTPVASWQLGDRELASFSPSDCWALRGGKIHAKSASDGNLSCKHAADEPAATVCIPLMAYGETLGLLHVRFAEAVRPAFEVATAASEQLSLATANLLMQDTLRRQAMRDPLTGVFNRRYMEETLDRETHRAARQKTVIGVVLIDLDHFKHYNDTLGHAAGDDLLRSAGAIMQRAVRAEDVVCRYGGDEFVIILPDATVTVVEQRTQKLSDSLANLSRPDATDARVTASIGVALFPGDGAASKDLLAAADRALYQAKREGRARIGWASSAA